ncbi:MAG: hypothetical protein MJZ86_07275 [Bacteroidales bacterium]|nr:hypothetical protein [Bacteroidales bacterium]
MDNLWNNIKEKGAAIRLRLSDKWQDFRERMHHKHRLVVMDTDTFQEKVSFELTGTNLFTAVGISVIVLIVLTTLLISFTPLRNLVPGYIRPWQREEIARNAQTIDSLENVISQHEQLIDAIQLVLSGKQLSVQQTQQVKELDSTVVVYKHSKADSLLRLDIEAKQKSAKKAANDKKRRK